MGDLGNGIRLIQHAAIIIHTIRRESHLSVTRPIFLVPFHGIERLATGTIDFDCGLFRIGERGMEGEASGSLKILEAIGRWWEWLVRFRRDEIGEHFQREIAENNEVFNIDWSLGVGSEKYNAPDVKKVWVDSKTVLVVGSRILRDKDKKIRHSYTISHTTINIPGDTCAKP